MASYNVPLRYLKKQFLQLAKMNTKISPETLTLKQISAWTENLFTQLALIDKILELEYQQDLENDEEELEESARRSHKFTKLRKKR